MHEMILAYIKALLVWPLIAGLLGGAFLFLFHKEIRDFIRRIASIKILGGEAIAIQQQTTPSTTEDIKPTQLSENVASGTTAELSYKDTLKSEQAAAITWEFRYLNYFLATATQNVLNWIVSQPNCVTENLFNATWGAFFRSPENIKATRDALLLHGLIEVNKGLVDTITATEKGRVYAHWTGRYAMGYVPVPWVSMALPQTKNIQN